MNKNMSQGENCVKGARRNDLMKTILGAQIRAARALLRWAASDLVRKSGVSLSTIHRAEAVDGETAMTIANATAIRRAFEDAGVELINGDSGGPGARLIYPVSSGSRSKKRE
jgi:transcriptional regulator with XRE-family HTH domain